MRPRKHDKRSLHGQTNREGRRAVDLAKKIEQRRASLEVDEESSEEDTDEDRHSQGGRDSSEEVLANV
ncbi:hypothetical protein OC834_006579 [Tilletia horrida]|nr:hypothetical protein OC834_006579 [Tilletia horrida]